MKKLSLTILLLFSHPAFSLISVFDYSNNEEEIKEKKPSLMVILNYQNIGRDINHNETSSTTGFNSLNETSEIGTSNISLELNKEFFADRLFSINLGARYGIAFGADQRTNEASGVTFEDKVSGSFYGGGLSLNLNFSAMGLKVQPFLSTYYISNEADYKLEYNSGNDTINIDYANERTFLNHSAGVRLIDYQSNTFSVFAVDYQQELDLSSGTSGAVSGNTIQFSNISGVEYSDLGFSIGFGFLF